DGLRIPGLSSAVQEAAAVLIDVSRLATMPERVGHYRFLSKIGEGGMRVVYAAEDTQLGRKVAIKTLPDEFSRDSDRVARFHREAQALASINHPNIGAIYDLEEAGGSRFLVLEFVEGLTLADRV